MISGPEVFTAIQVLSKIIQEVIQLASDLIGVSNRCSTLISLLETLSGVLKQIEDTARNHSDTAQLKSLTSCLDDCRNVLIKYKGELQRISRSTFRAAKWKMKKQELKYLDDALEASKSTLLLQLTVMNREPSPEPAPPPPYTLASSGADSRKASGREVAGPAVTLVGGFGTGVGFAALCGSMIAGPPGALVCGAGAGICMIGGLVRAVIKENNKAS